MNSNPSSQSAMLSTVDTLTQALSDLLQRNRPLPDQVLHGLLDRYVKTEEELPGFFEHQLAQLDDEALDLLLSPAYTPQLADKAVAMDILQDARLTEAEVEQVGHGLVGVVTSFTSPTGVVAHLRVPEVCLDRFVHRLGLGAPIDSRMFDAVKADFPPEEQTLANALLRNKVWADRADLFLALLPQLEKVPTERLEHLQALTDFLRTYRPKNLNELIHHLESYIRSCEADMMQVDTRSFHDEHLQEKYAGLQPEQQMDAIRQSYRQMRDTGRSLLLFSQQAVAAGASA